MNDSGVNPAAMMVAGMLARGKAHGYELHEAVSRELGSVCRLGLSNVYALHGRLEREGLVKHQRVGQGTRPDRNVFALTRKGRMALDAWLETPVSSFRDLRVEFLAKLHFATLRSEAAARDLVARQYLTLSRRHKQGASSRAIDGAGPGETAAGSYRAAMRRAGLAWLKGLRPCAKP